MNGDYELNKILNKRVVPNPPSNLAYRIQQAAHQKTQQKSNVDGSFSWNKQILNMLFIPRPAFIMAFCLVIGLGIGMYANNENLINQDWSSLLEIQQEGDWL